MSFTYKKVPIIAAMAIATATQLSHAQQLEEIIVTAQKRSESLQDVPISVSAMQGDKMQEAGIPNMAAMADHVPNLHIANAAVNTNIYMRGVGSGNNQGFEQSVGMYIDGVYMGRGRQYRNAFMDLERVEVLRGPQGTLFGRNTVAGAINVTSASPHVGEETTGEIAVAVESNGGLTTEGFLSGSLTDTFALRFGFKYRETDGFVENLYTGEDEPQLEEASYRITAAWEASDNLDVRFKYSNSDEQRTGAPSATWLYLDQAQRNALFPNRSAFADAAYALTDINFPGLATTAGDDFSTFKDNGFGNDEALGLGRYPDGDDAEVENFSLNIDYQWGDYTLTSVTGLSKYVVQSGSDVDWLPLRFISRDDDQDYEQFSQELRITSPGGEFFDFVAGAYFDESELVTDRLVMIDGSFDDLFGDVPGNLVSPLLPGIPLRLIGATSLFPLVSDPLFQYFTNQAGRSHLYELDSESWAVFAQGTFNLSDSFRVTVGLRYTREDKDVFSRQFLVDDESGLDTPSHNFYLGQAQATIFNTYAYTYTDDRSTDELIPSINVQWDVGEDSMMYASFSQGFKSGGFTAADDGEPGTIGFLEWSCTIEPDGTVDVPSCYDPTIPNEDFEFDDESVDAFEIGGKHTLLDGAMTVNWAAFYTEYDNLQTAIFKGVGFTVKNAGSSEISGVEVDSRWQVTDNLQLGGNVAWLNAEYADFGDAPCTAIQLDANPQCGVAGNAGGTFNDLTGEATLYASDYSASIRWDYGRPMGDWELFISGEVNYRSDFNSAGDSDPIDKIPSITKVNLRIGLRGDQWEVMFYGRNILDEAALTQSFDTPVLAGSHSRFQDEGEVFGLRAKYAF
ncbi:MAG: iron complex outermembrane receptor protein [Halieaceae bacterium]|jgi:iron complex outermembrane receptor protein